VLTPYSVQILTVHQRHNVDHRGPPRAVLMPLPAGDSVAVGLAEGWIVREAHRSACRHRTPPGADRADDDPGDPVTSVAFSVKIAGMARKKTTVYIDEALLRAAKVAAARAGKREYEVFEDALRRYLGFAGAVEQIWAGISPEEAPSEEEAARISAEELAAVRAERSTRRVG